MPSSRATCKTNPEGDADWVSFTVNPSPAHEPDRAAPPRLGIYQWNRVMIRSFTFGISLLLAAAAHARADEPTEYTLDNGLRVRLAPLVGDKQVMVLLFARAGFLEEPAGRPHLAHVTEHLTVFDLPPAEAKAVQGWYKTGMANGETLADVMYFDLSVPPDEVDIALKVQAARLSAVEFKQATLEREIPRTLQEVEFVERSKFAAAGKFALAPFVQAAVHGKTDQPLRARTKKLNIEDVAAFHQRTFRPDRAAVVVVGEFDPAAVKKMIDAAFGKIDRPKAAPAARPALKSGDSTADWDVSTRHLFVAWPIPAATHADHPPLTLATLALMESLMFDGPFNKQGTAFPQLNDTEGLFLLGVQAKSDADLDGVKTTVFDKVAALAKPAAWTKADVERLRKQLGRKLMFDTDLDKITLPPRVTKTMARAQMELQRMTKTLAWGDLDAYRKRLDEVTGEQIATAVDKHLTAKGAAVVRVQKGMK